MRTKIFATALVFGTIAMTASAASSVYDFTEKSIDGTPTPLASYKGKVALVVNVASQCGFTPQYAGLESLYKKYKDQGFVILGFPANNFGSQEPGSNEEIKTFCTRKFAVDFPMFSKISVLGDDKAPLYKYLTGTGPEVKWNFTKFLVDKTGKVVARFDSSVTPESPEVTAAVEKALKN